MGRFSTKGLLGKVLSVAKRGVGDNTVARTTTAMANVVGVFYWAACLTILFFGVTIVPDRIGASLAALFVWGVMQLVVLAMLWAAARRKGGRADVFNWSSSYLLCGLFVGGMAWVTLFDVAMGFGAEVPWPVRIVPCALCMVVATPLAMVHIVQYCKATDEQDFVVQAVPGALIAALVTFFPLADAPLVPFAISVFTAILWLVGQRVLGPLKAEYRTVTTSQGQFSTKAVLAAALALFLAGGMICPIAKNPLSLATFRYGELFLVAICALLTGVLLGGARLFGQRVPKASRVFTLISALAYGLLGVCAHGLTGLIAGVLLGAFLVNASFILYTLSLHIMSDEHATTRFWLGQIFVFVSYLMGVTGAAYLISLSGDSEIAPFIMVSLILLLVFAYAFDGAWAIGQLNEVRTARVTLEPAVSPDVSEDIERRCAALATEAGLTNKEREVLKLIAQGWNVPMIARSFVVSQATVRTHVKHLYQKLDVHSRNELISLVASTLCASPPK